MFVDSWFVGYNGLTMARFPSSSPAPTLFLVAAGLVLVSAIAARVLIPPTIRMRISQEEYRLMEASVQKKHDEAGPQLQSAKFATGDALAGIGADWTFVEQNVLSGTETPTIPGTKPQRHTRLKQGDDAQVQLVIDEAGKGDAAAFAKTLKGYTALSLAGREGYLVPNSSGGDSFLLVGSTNIVLLTAVPQIDWKQPLSAPLAAYIATVNIP